MRNSPGKVSGVFVWDVGGLGWLRLKTMERYWEFKKDGNFGRKRRKEISFMTFMRQERELELWGMSIVGHTSSQDPQ